MTRSILVVGALAATLGSMGLAASGGSIVGVFAVLTIAFSEPLPPAVTELIRVVPVSELIGEAIQRTALEKSVSSLFD